ncbi:MAG: LPS-assembly protein LptD [Desulfobacterales bacterium]|nr:LPS-assembly protein LptD [Desulfobacterales bacterium]
MIQCSHDTIRPSFFAKKRTARLSRGGSFLPANVLPANFFPANIFPANFFPANFFPALLALFIGCAVLAPAAGTAQSLNFSRDEHPDEPWELIADEGHYEKNVYMARGNAIISKRDKKISADFIRFDNEKMTAEAEGRVVVASGGDVLIGQRLTIDLRTEVGTLYKGTIFLKEHHFYIKGDRIEKTGKQSYSAENASVTTCDGDRPDWKITARNLEVTVEGWGKARHASLWAGRMPVMYTPYFMFPAKTKRQSGFLAPQFGISDRKGAVYIQPYFWAISDNSDATFYSHFMAKRGEKLGVEHRYILDETSRGATMFDYLRDRKVDDGSEEAGDYGYDDDAYTRLNRDRYWLRAKLDQAAPGGFLAQLDLDLVSDQDYLQEFKHGYTGFNPSEKFFEDFLQRGLDTYDDPVRENRLNLIKSWPGFSLNTGVLWYDNVIKRRLHLTDRTAQRAPYVEFDASRRQILQTPLFYTLDSEWINFYRDDGEKGMRLDVHPRVLLPLRIKNYLSLEPSVGARETVWRVDADTARASTNVDRSFLTRTMLDVKLDLYTNIFRVFEVDMGGVDRIKHVVKPEITYEYIPEKDQDEYPYFDDLDRVERKNLVTYALTNTFTYRLQAPRPPADPAPGDPAADAPDSGAPAPEPARTYYRQFCRIKLEQSYDIYEADADDPSEFANGKTREPFSPILGELTLSPGKFIYLKADAEWSTYTSRIESRNLAMSLWDSRGDKFYVDYRHDRDSVESVLTRATAALIPGFSAYAMYEYDLHDERRIESGAGLIYQARCWSVNLGYIDEVDDWKFAFMINLHGLGKIGSGW